ncbi:hypothetical protein HNP52_000069 [Sphingomonas kyeonggiensis]|uniref:ATP-binding protein n=1 Tax=Sphingomonas kyeonggiensis TaxID=1268553 RepID=A0A7W7NPN4_9SPHN|nr:ATP-binding protein [Sphingomonas kyeonggiensis]MBB4837018.1 hypothetical protein [Sphingomonas kyeonggiensis]
MSLLSERVSVDSRYQRSARLDADVGVASMLAGYVLQPTVADALTTMAAALEGGGRAFTWTGPYGGGKSSAALLLAALISDAREHRKAAEAVVPASLAARVRAGFAMGAKRWRIVAITARRRSLREEIAEAAAHTLGWETNVAADAARDDGALLKALAGSAERGGVLLLLDELGKALEYAAATDGDIHLLQDLGEWAARSGGRGAIVGILHQSFDQYAGRAGRSARDEWAKVQGRFMDIAFVTAIDETVALIGRALTSTSADAEPMREVAEHVATAVVARRPGEPAALAQALLDAWPLHPVSTLLLGPISRQRFAQNERSVFGFLSSSEPGGFQEHCTRHHSGDAQDWYGPDKLWDYLALNFGVALSAGPDSRRYALALEAIDRAASRGGEVHARVTKVAAVLEFFRNGSGLAVADEFITEGLGDLRCDTVMRAIEDLCEWAVLIRQPRLGGYALFAGSDFDLDEALTRARDQVGSLGLAELPARVGLGQAAAKRHYFRTGALRTFSISIELVTEEDAAVEAVRDSVVASLAPAKGAGRLVLLVSDGAVTPAGMKRYATKLAKALGSVGAVAAIGVTGSVYHLREVAADLAAIERISRDNAQLEGDRLARREIAARRSALVDDAYREAMRAFESASWRLSVGPAAAISAMPLSLVASCLADAAFTATPVINSELLQRDRPSSNAMAALRDLGHAMAERADQPNLGIEGYPAERGLYMTLIEPFGLHKERAGRWQFCDPDPDLPAGTSLAPAWAVMSDAPELSLAELYDIWAAPPFGLKRGVMPVLAFAFLLARRSERAVYVDGIFQPEPDTVLFDRLLQDPAAIRVRRIDRSETDLAFMADLARGLGVAAKSSSLQIAAALFQRFTALSQFARRTGDVPPGVAAIRDAVLRANDPEDLLFETLPKVAAKRADTVLAALAASEQAYPALLDKLVETLAATLGTDREFSACAARADAVVGITGDLRFDAFATRVRAFADGGTGDMEGLASLLIHKPPRSWTDRERDQAMLELVRFGRSFREAEALASLHGRDSDMEAMALIVGMRGNPRVLRFELNQRERDEADKLADELLSLLSRPGSSSLSIAALARAADRLGAIEEHQPA